MFGLDWFVVVVVWSGVDNISFSYKNRLVWIYGFVPFAGLDTKDPERRRQTEHREQEGSPLQTYRW